MAYDEIAATKAFIRDDTTDLTKYFDGLDSLQYLYSYEQLYKRSRKDILTWIDAREYFLFNDRRELFWESHRSYSHFILLSHTVVEYISARLLLEYFNPQKGREEMLSALKDMRQFSRQEMMYNLEIISGSLNNDMNQVRGVRNDFAHEVSPHFELNYEVHPVSVLNNVKKVTMELVEILYEESYQNILKIFENVFSDTFPEDYSTTSTAELIDIYQFKIDDGDWVYDQEFARELYERGVNPESAPPFENFESVNYLDDMGTGWADPGGMGVPQLRAVPFVPDSVRIEEEITIQAYIEFISDSMIHELYDDIPDEFKWYSYLMIDDQVVDTQPTDSDGCPNPRIDETNTRIPIEFEYIFTKGGEHDITVGIQIVNESFRYHLVLFETEVKAYGPFTP